MGNAGILRYGRLVLIPGLITLAITLVRLAGELLEGPAVLFNASPGGGGAVVGIVWLVPVFGIVFALRLEKDSEARPRLLRTLGLVFLAIVLLPAIGGVGAALGMDPNGRGLSLLFAAGSVVTVIVVHVAWPSLTRILLAYALAARIPVTLVMLAAIIGRWGTHYDVAPEGFPQMAPLAKWFWIGVIPQLTVWIAFTVTIGALFALIAVAVSRRGR